MPHRLEIALTSDLLDAEGEGLRQKAKDYFGLHLDTVRTVSIITIDADLSDEQLERIRQDLFHGPYYSSGATTLLDPRAQQDPCRPTLWGIERIVSP